MTQHTTHTHTERRRDVSIQIDPIVDSLTRQLVSFYHRVDLFSFLVGCSIRTNGNDRCRRPFEIPTTTGVFHRRLAVALATEENVRSKTSVFILPHFRRARFFRHDQVRAPRAQKRENIARAFSPASVYRARHVLAPTFSYFYGRKLRGAVDSFFLFRPAVDDANVPIRSSSPRSRWRRRKLSAFACSHTWYIRIASDGNRRCGVKSRRDAAGKNSHMYIHARLFEMQKRAKGRERGVLRVTKFSTSLSPYLIPTTYSALTHIFNMTYWLINCLTWLFIE